LIWNSLPLTGVREVRPSVGAGKSLAAEGEGISRR
jgi:hypothetical protein